jgi:Cu-processing system permease protein
VSKSAPAAALARVSTIALSTYREAVRARVLLSVFALGLATCAYSLIVATLSLHNEERVVADFGSSSLSFYGVLIAIVLGSTSLYREVEHKTVFPILSRPIRRWEYLVGKYFGSLITVIVFVAIESAAILLLLGLEAGASEWKIGGVTVAFSAVLVAAMFRFPRAGVFVAIPWAIVMAGVAWALASWSSSERQLVTMSALLAVFEVSIVAAVATLFASFSSPFLTATCSFLVFVIGRSADTMAHLPVKTFGTVIPLVGRGFARALPNLHVYVPARSLLLGQVTDQHVGRYVASAGLYAVAYTTILLVVGAVAFGRRDFS